MGDNQARLEPAAVPGLTGILAVAAGRAHSLALRADGSVVAWGANGQGQLGLGTQTNHNTPQAVSGLANVVAIAAAGDQSFAVRNDGTVWAWGDNDLGQLGDGSNTDRSQPVQLTALSGAGVSVVSVAASASHTLALDQLGNVWAWGDNSAGQHGDTAVSARSTPVQVAGVSGSRRRSPRAAASRSRSTTMHALVELGPQRQGPARRRRHRQSRHAAAGRGGLRRRQHACGLAHRRRQRPCAGAAVLRCAACVGQQRQRAAREQRGRRHALGAGRRQRHAVQPAHRRCGQPATAWRRRTAGSVYGWGANSAGQLGNGASGSAITQPVPANNLSID